MSTWELGLVTTVLLGVALAVSRLVRCHHPNPHYIRPVVREDATGNEAEVQPARYICYECGRTWIAVQRDAAWHPTHLRRMFSGFDEDKAVRAATRASIEEEQRRFLAVHRAFDEHASASAHPKRSHARRRQHANVVDLNSRRPA